MDDIEPTTTSTSRRWSQKIQYILDKIAPHTLPRWIFFGVCLIIYAIRVYTLEAFYIVTYGLSIYLLNQLIGFLSPKFDPENADEDAGGAGLPTSSDEEYRPFTRRLPEFNFWVSCTRSVVISFFLTFFGIVDVPVFWPILLMYFCVLFFITMKKQIEHMWKHNYNPFFSLGKPKPGQFQKSNK
jgi:hypothetical protein